MNVEEFKEYCRKNNDNQLEGNGIVEMLKNLKNSSFDFIFICKKCNSTKVQIIGEDGIDYGEMTGYSPGSNVVKCLECGNATTIWK